MYPEEPLAVVSPSSCSLSPARQSDHYVRWKSLRTQNETNAY